MSYDVLLYIIKVYNNSVNIATLAHSIFHSPEDYDDFETDSCQI